MISPGYSQVKSVCKDCLSLDICTVLIQTIQSDLVLYPIHSFILLALFYSIFAPLCIFVLKFGLTSINNFYTHSLSSVREVCPVPNNM